MRKRRYVSHYREIDAMKKNYGSRLQSILVAVATVGIMFPGIGVRAAEEGDPLAGIVNFRAYSAQFASSGQPTVDQLALLRDAGFERVVYIAFSDHDNSLPSEDRLVKELGLEYVHIPIEWSAPTVDDFNLFAGAMQQSSTKKTLLHCQVNYRASAFSFLYRVIYNDVPVAAAMADMNSVWTPNETWRDLIFEVLRANGVSPDCDGCDWSVND